MVFVANGLTVSREETEGDITVITKLENTMLFWYDKENSTVFMTTKTLDPMKSNITMLTGVNVTGSVQATFILLADIYIARFDDIDSTCIADTYSNDFARIVCDCDLPNAVTYKPH